MTKAAWIAIGLSQDLEPGGATGVIVDGREWALWRGVSGRLHLWEDRCPHRGMRLSHGFVRGDHFGCVYHGWQYDESGQCAVIPDRPQTKPPASLRVRGAPVAESGGVIWACFADDPPSPPEFDNAVPVRSIYLDAPLPETLAALGSATPAIGPIDAYQVKVDDDIWLAAGQKVDDRHSALHIVALTGATGARRAATWAAGLSRALEPAMA